MSEFFHFADAKAVMYRDVPTDLWHDAKIGDIVEYLYNNKNLKLSDDQKQLMHYLAKEFATDDTGNCA